MILADPDFIFVLGDSVRHYAAAMPDAHNASVWIQQNITSIIANTFPSSPLHMHAISETIGNNDVLPDYWLPASQNSSELNRFVDAWVGTLSASEIETVQTGGYYSRVIAPGLLMICLNSIIYSVKLEPPLDEADVDPFGQFAWLSSSLAAARSAGNKVYIVGHIPPVVDSYARKPMWLSRFSDQYLSIVDAYGDVVISQMFGHFHTDEVKG